MIGLVSVRAELDEDAGELPYADGGTVAAHAVGLLADHRTDAVLATIGYLEAPQDHTRRHGLPTDAVSVLLGPARCCPVR